jgi:hypothetical protein
MRGPEERQFHLAISSQPAGTDNLMYMDDDESDDSDDDFKHNDFTPVFEIGPQNEELQKALAEDEGERIRQSVLIKGVDALGWYMPFHYTDTQ